MMMTHKSLARLWFFLGLGSALQLVASLSITELVILLVTPFLMQREYGEMRHTGVHVFFGISCLVILGGILSILKYDTPMYFIIRKMATVVLVTFSIPFFHRMIRKDASGIKWYLLGCAISLVLCTFIFKQSVEVATMGESSEDIMKGAIFWIRRVGAFTSLPYCGWYFQTPLPISIGLSSCFALYAILTTSSGRSAALVSLATATLMILGRKKQQSIRRVGKLFLFMIMGAIVFVYVTFLVYSKAASSGALGEEALKKYELQTKAGTGIWSLLMGGRFDSIVPFYIAATEDPIFGIGLTPVDDGSRQAEFLRKFGTLEDYEAFYNKTRSNNGKLFFIPGHSCMGGFWITYGIFGLIFWIYVVFVMLRYIKSDAWAVPQWYGWLACGIPGWFWAIIFSPFAARTGLPIFVVACLYCRAVRRGRATLPPVMVQEIIKSERR